MSDTIRPESYPELENEVYLSLDAETERPTLIPGCNEQLGMQVDCMLGEQE